MKNLLLEIWTDKLSDYIILDYILKIWVTVLMSLAVIGISFMLFQIITNPSQFDNATFGIFDTLG
jgi:hypothetical protein